MRSSVVVALSAVSIALILCIGHVGVAAQLSGLTQGVVNNVGSVVSTTNTVVSAVSNVVTTVDTNVVSTLSKAACDVSTLCPSDSQPYCVPSDPSAVGGNCTCTCWQTKDLNCYAYDKPECDTCGQYQSKCTYYRSYRVHHCDCTTTPICQSNSDCPDSACACTQYECRNNPEMVGYCHKGSCMCINHCKYSGCGSMLCPDSSLKTCNRTDGQCNCIAKCQTNADCTSCGTTTDHDVGLCKADGSCGCVNCLVDSDCDHYPKQANHYFVCNSNVCESVEQCPSDAWCKTNECGELKYASCNTSTGRCLCEQCHSVSDCYGGAVYCDPASEFPTLTCVDSRCKCIE